MFVARHPASRCAFYLSTASFVNKLCDSALEHTHTQGLCKHGDHRDYLLTSRFILTQISTCRSDHDDQIWKTTLDVHRRCTNSVVAMNAIAQADCPTPGERIRHNCRVQTTSTNDWDCNILMMYSKRYCTLIILVNLETRVHIALKFVLQNFCRWQSFLSNKSPYYVVTRNNSHASPTFFSTITH